MCGGGREDAEVCTGNEVVGNGKAVLVCKVCEDRGKAFFFTESEVRGVLAVEVVKIGLGVVVVLVEIEGEGIVGGLVTKERVRIEGEELCAGAVFGGD